MRNFYSSVSAVLCVIINFVSLSTPVSAIFIDKGDPYRLGPLMVGQLTLSETLQGAPMHTIGTD